MFWPQNFPFFNTNSVFCVSRDIVCRRQVSWLYFVAIFWYCAMFLLIPVSPTTEIFVPMVEPMTLSETNLMDQISFNQLDKCWCLKYNFNFLFNEYKLI